MITDIFTAKPDHWANLQWSLSAPFIVRDCGLPLLPVARQAALADFFARTDIRAQLQPVLDAELYRLDQQARSGRLGIYFEELWSFAFQHHPHYQLLARNLPLRAEGRTLGELDFVVQHLPDDTTEHWEVAVKFYLQVDAQHWVGPGLRDRLDIKLSRMREHQLPVIHQPAAAEILHQKDICIKHQWALIPGRLFTPLHPLQPPHPRLPEDSTINRNCSHYWWATAAEFQQHFASAGLQWLRLPKRTWLAPIAPGQAKLAGAAQPGELLGGAPLHSPACVAGIAESGERSRGFIVPDQWLSAALARLNEPR